VLGKTIRLRRLEPSGGPDRGGDLTVPRRKAGAVTARTLAWRKFKQHRLAIISAIVLLLMYTVCLLPDFFAPYVVDESLGDNPYLPPQRLHVFDTQGKFHFPPFVYGVTKKIDLVQMLRIYTEDTTKIYQLRFFVSHKKALAGPGSVQTSRRLFGVQEGGMLALLGTDDRSRDLFSRSLYGGQISLTVGVFGVGISVVLAVIIGIISGFFAGAVDMVIQRLSEILSSVPTLPLWLALSAILPRTWPPIYIYWGIVTILGLLGWMGMARAIRALVLSSRERVYVMASEAGGGSSKHIMVRHIFPSVITYVIVATTIHLPAMILTESSLSFLGLGIQPPMTSWGLMLNQAQNVYNIVRTPWMLLPAAFLILTTVAYNFLGDGVRDAADPYR
jgi:peptide/nickel transport system permease protein